MFVINQPSYGIFLKKHFIHNQDELPLYITIRTKVFAYTKKLFDRLSVFIYLRVILANNQH